MSFGEVASRLKQQETGKVFAGFRGIVTNTAVVRIVATAGEELGDLICKPLRRARRCVQAELAQWWRANVMKASKILAHLCNQVHMEVGGAIKIRESETAKLQELVAVGRVPRLIDGLQGDEVPAS